jgi:hypothetical protein
MWFAKVRDEYGDELQIDWQPFLLTQINSKEGPEWKAWEHTDDAPNLSLVDMRGGEAARRQGTQLFEAFQLALLKARHEDRKDLANREVVLDAARSAGLDMARFLEDLEDKSIIKDIGDSHTEAVEKHGAFGVPTFIFSNGTSAFIKAYNPPKEEALKMFEELMSLASTWNYIGEIKRPQPPWPKGVFT